MVSMNDNNQFRIGMTSKAVIVLLGLLLVAQAQYPSTPIFTNNDQSQSSDTSSNVASEQTGPYVPQSNKGSSHSSNSGQRTSNGSGYNHNRSEDEILEEMLTTITFVVVAASVVAVGLGGLLIWRCQKRREVTNRIKDHMRIRKQQYATNMGLNVFDMNRNFHTIHV